MAHPYSPEELAYIRRAQMEFGPGECRKVPVEKLIRLGMQLAQGKDVQLEKPKHKKV